MIVNYLHVYPIDAMNNIHVNFKTVTNKNIKNQPETIYLIFINWKLILFVFVIEELVLIGFYSKIHKMISQRES